MNPVKSSNLPVKLFFKQALRQLGSLSKQFIDHFPNYCVLCQAPVTGRKLCHSCIVAIKTAPISCFQCAEPLQTAHSATLDNLGEQHFICGRCQKQPPHFQRVIAGGLYLQPLSGLLQLFKFQQRIQLTHVLADILLQSIQQTADYQKPDAIIAVPLHKKRLRQRGYNQAQLIASVLSKELNIPLIRKGIYRDKITEEQTRLTLPQRKKNLRGAFRLEAKLPQHVAIVDDVITTGSTTDELAKVFIKHQVTNVDIWCIAKTPQMK